MLTRLFHVFLGRALQRRTTWLLIVLLGIAWITLSWGLNERTRQLIARTIGLSTATCLGTLPVAFVLAFVVTRTDAAGRRVFMAALFASLFLPLYLQLTGWQAGLGQQGWLQAMTGTLATPPVLAGWRGTIWVHTVAAIPWAALIFVVGLQTVPAGWEEAALLEGGRWRTIWHVTLPATRPAWTVAALWVFAATASEMTVTDVYRIRTFAEEVFLSFALGDPQAVAGGLPVAGAPESPVRPALVFGGGLTLWMAYAMVVSLLGWLPPAHDTVRRRTSTTCWTRHRALWGLLLLATAIILWGIPLGNLVYNAGLSITAENSQLTRTWSLQKCLTLVLQSPWQFRSEFGWSLACANLSALAAVLCAVPLAWWARSSLAGSLSVIAMIAIFLVLPGPVLGIAIIGLLNHEWPPLRFLYDRTLTAPCLAMWARALPLVLLLIWQAFRTLPQAPLDAARLDGASPLRLLVGIAVPQRATALLTGWLVAMAIAIGELPATVLVAPPGVNTLSISIFGLVHYGVDDRLAGLCLSVLLVLAATGALGFFTLRRGFRGYTNR